MYRGVRVASKHLRCRDGYGGRPLRHLSGRPARAGGGVAAVRLLEAAGCGWRSRRPVVLGQPALNTGEPEAPPSSRTSWSLRTYEACDTVGSCAAMVHTGTADPRRRVAERAEAIAAGRTAHLVSRRPAWRHEESPGRAAGRVTVTVHDACMACGAGPQDVGRALLEAAGATLLEMAEPSSAAASGDVRRKHGEISAPCRRQAGPGRRHRRDYLAPATRAAAPPGGRPAGRARSRARPRRRAPWRGRSGLHQSPPRRSR